MKAMAVAIAAALAAVGAPEAVADEDLIEQLLNQLWDIFGQALGFADTPPAGESAENNASQNLKQVSLLLPAIQEAINAIKQTGLLGQEAAFEKALKDAQNDTATATADWLKLSNLQTGRNNARSRVALDNVLLCGAAQTLQSCGSQICKKQPPPPPTAPCLPSSCQPIQIIASGDPNDKSGLPGVGSRRYITGSKSLSYVVSFGNEPNASAAAQTVTITDPLATSTDDVNTFSLGPIAFGNHFVTPTPGTTFSTIVDLRPSTNLLVGINANVDLAAGVATWKFSSLDPSTGLPTTDPSAGFLPPGGNGSVFFSVAPKQILSTGTQVQNQATVVFDANAPIKTPIWTNTLDNTPPTSHVVTLPPNEYTISFPVSWAGTDVGAGVQDFTIFSSDNGGAFTAWLQNVTATSATFTGQPGHTYAFYSIARDLVGNVEPGKTTADATTQVVIDTTPPVITPNISGTLGANGWFTSAVTVTWSVADTESGIASSTGCSPTNLTNDTAGTVLTCSATNGVGLSNSVSVTIKIDQTPPVISGLPGPGCILWPPNHELIKVATVTANDAGSGIASFTLSGTSNETDSDITKDIVITGSGLQPKTVQLEAERSGTGNGRVYTLTAVATDQAGNHAVATATCTVPHNQ